MKLTDFEIMAPVGSRESLAAAIQAGADSIYFGIENLNMRARSASTFTIDDLKEIARTCDEHGMKSYLTVNTIIYDSDMPALEATLDAAAQARVRKTAPLHSEAKPYNSYMCRAPNCEAMKISKRISSPPSRK